ncbi:MAG: UDP-2,3-diacylglucosamine diphosphatase [Candidatus Zhuqueibacterota bacterium]
MERTYFISDIHFGAGTNSDDSAKLKKLTAFFNYINQPNNRLYILGDLFDFWFEYKYAVPNQNYSVLFQISKLIENNVAVHFLPGNHDSWIKNFFRDQVGIQVHSDVCTTEIQTKKFYLFHGDGISKKDVGYRLLKRIFRNRFNVFLYRLLHPDLGIPLARLMSSTSRKHTTDLVLHDEGDYLDFATDKFKDGFDFVIVGHSHRPALERIDHHVFLNLGDWIKHDSYGKFEAGELTLHFWNG